VLGVVLGFILLGGCSESLFGVQRSGQGTDAGGDGGIVPATCPAPCIADVAADVGRTDSHWRYLEDHRDRIWTEMISIDGVLTGADAGNHITTCKANPGAPACRALPDALLISSAGAASDADPAIEFTVPAPARVIQLSLHVFVPSSGDQTIRLYRNSREDVLFTGVATAGSALARAITLDALAGDRFLVAVAPTGGGAADVGLQLFVSDPGMAFPSTCQLALPTPTAGGSVVKDACSGADFIHFDDQNSPAPFSPSSGPFQEQGGAFDNPAGTYLKDLREAVLDHAGDLTMQFWVRVRSVVSTSNAAWLFSDLDLNDSGGLGIAIVPGASPMIDVATCSSSSPVSCAHATTAYPNDGNWHFVRAVVTGGKLHVCLNGTHKASVSASDELTTSVSPYLGKDVDPSAAGSFFDGWLDDVRMITGVLPCGPPP
jgi:hypothetical protein